MATVVVAFDGTRVNNSDTNTNWGNFPSGGGAPASEDQLAYQGTAVNTKVTSATFDGIDLDPASPQMNMTLAANKLWFVKVIVSDSFDLNVTEGVRIALGSSNADYYTWPMSGTGANRSVYNVYPPQGGYLITALDPNVVAWRGTTTGTPDLTAVDWYGIQCRMIVGAAKSENLACDCIDIGTGLTLTRGDGADADGNWDSFITADQGTDSATAPARAGVVTSPGPGLIVVHGLLTIGESANATEFTSSGFVITYPDGYHSGGLVGTELTAGNVSDIIAISDTFIGQGSDITVDTRPDFRVAGTSGTIGVDGSTFQKHRRIKLNNNVTATGIIVSGSGQIDPTNNDYGGYQTLDTSDYLDSVNSQSHTFVNGGGCEIIFRAALDDWTANTNIFFWGSPSNSRIQVTHVIAEMRLIVHDGVSETTYADTAIQGNLTDGDWAWIRIAYLPGQATFYYSFDTADTPPQDINWTASQSPTGTARVIGAPNSVIVIGAGAAGALPTPGDYAYFSVWDGLAELGDQVLLADWRWGPDFTGSPGTRADGIQSFNWEEQNTPTYTLGDDNTGAADLDGATISDTTSYAALRWDVNADPNGELDNITFEIPAPGGAIAVTDRLDDVDATTGTTHTTASWTPSGNTGSTLIASVMTKNLAVAPELIDITGNGVTWRPLADSGQQGNRWYAYWIADGDGATTGTTTLTWASSRTESGVNFTELTNVSPYSFAVQEKFVTQSFTNAWDIAGMAALSDASSLVIGMSSKTQSGTSTPDGGWTELVDTTVGGYAWTVVYDNAIDPGGDFTGTAGSVHSFAIELSQASASPSHAIEFGKDTPSSVTLTNPTFTNYNSANGQSDSTFYNNTGGALTINLTGATGNTSYRNGVNASTTVNRSVNVIVRNVVPGSQIAVIADAGGPETEGDILLNKPAVPASHGYVDVESNGEYVETLQNVVSASTSSDFEIIAYAHKIDWTPIGSPATLVSQFHPSTVTSRVFEFGITQNEGDPVLTVLDSSGTQSTFSVTTDPGFTDNTYGWLRVVYDYDGGSGANALVSFYSSTDGVDTDPQSVGWTLLGTDEATQRVVNNTARPVRIGERDHAVNEPWLGRVAYCTMWIDGTSLTGETLFEADWRTGPDFDASDDRPDDADSTITWSLESAATYTTAASANLNETFVYSYPASDQPVYIRVRKSSNPERYLPLTLQGTITNQGLTVTAQQIKDTIAEAI